MRSFALYQIIATLATLALFLPYEATALPVRGALGNLNTRARVARRAAAVARSHSSSSNTATLGKRFKMVTYDEDSTLPANPKQQLLKKVEIVDEAERKVLFKRRDAGIMVDAVPSPVSSPASQTGTEIAPGAERMALALTRPSVVVQQNIVAPAALSVENDDNASDDSTSSDSSSSNEAAPNAEAIYQSYIDQMSDSITATVTVTSTMIVPAGDAAATDFKVAAVVPVQSSAPAAVTPDAAAIYNSYVAQMNAAAASAS